MSHTASSVELPPVAGLREAGLQHPVQLEVCPEDSLSAQVVRHSGRLQVAENWQSLRLVDQKINSVKLLPGFINHQQADLEKHCERKKGVRQRSKSRRNAMGGTTILPSRWLEPATVSLLIQL